MPSEAVRSLFQASLLALGVCRCNGAPWKMVRAHVVAHIVTMMFGIKSLLNMKPELKPQPYNSFFFFFGSVEFSLLCMGSLYCGVQASVVAPLDLCAPGFWSPRGSSVRGILQARILECEAISFSRGSS